MALVGTAHHALNDNGARCRLEPSAHELFGLSDFLCSIPDLAQFPLLEKKIRELHPDEVPEITALPTMAASKAYWQ